MTGFATETGEAAGHAWVWDLRSVNARGLDLRLRLPEWLSGLEPKLRGRINENLSRGNLSVSLRVQRAETGSPLEVDREGLAVVLKALQEVEAGAEASGFVLGPTGALELLGFRGVLASQDRMEAEPDAAVLDGLVGSFDTALASLVGMRRAEGDALSLVLSRQLDEIGELTARAREAAAERQNSAAERLRQNIRLILDNADFADEGRLAQELAVLAVKADITEEIDRLEAHVGAARELLRAEGPIGRKLDFLMQEFNREANTLCSKSGSADLTRTGLDLKAVIDQMREQVQNVE
ncbi:YicC/YloC family endoribonuclease [Brevirhabdus pacifica]|nr:YicC/YloC family endoribonuclease [Brevirhabdus pacifica]